MRVDQYYKIAGLILQVSADPAYLDKNLKDFAVAASSQAQVQIAFKEELFTEAYPEKPLVDAKLLTIYEEPERFIVRYKNPTGAECYILWKEKNVAEVFLTKSALERETGWESGLEEIGYSVRDAFFFYMQRFGRIAVHSASFLYKGMVWLFSAPSGTGKSTHVSLWRQQGEPIEDFNGDVAVCRLDENGNAVADGLPWCGTSGLYRNETAPLGGVIFLRQSCHNMANELTPLESVLQLSARCLTPNWNGELTECNLSTAEKIAKKSLTGILYCTPERDAVEASKALIENYLQKK